MNKHAQLSVMGRLGIEHRIAGDRFSIGPVRPDGNTFTLSDGTAQVAVLLDGKHLWPEPYRSAQEKRARDAVIVAQEVAGSPTAD